MSQASAVLAGRAAAEHLMVDACLVTRGGVPVFNESTGQYDDSNVTTIYAGPCKVQTRDVVVLEADAGDTEVPVLRWSVHFPVDGSETIRRGDIITITAATLDDALLGRRFTVTGSHVGTAKSARRIPVSADG